jgi:VWFA-related protein
MTYDKSPFPTKSVTRWCYKRTVNQRMRMLAIIGVLLAAGMLSAQDAPFVMKLDSNSILVDVTVTDSAKKSVTNLPREAFSIYEDGKLQELTGFYSVDTPYSILLLFDRSTSTENQWPLLQMALERFFDALRPQDSVSIATFTGSTTLRLDWWPLSKGRPADVLSAVKIGKVTDFYGAINWSENRLKKLSTRKGVVVLTDGLDSTGIMRLYPPEVDDDFQKLLRNVRSGGIPYYFVALNTDFNSDSGSATGRARMEQLAEASGGGIVFPQSADDIVPFFGDIAHSLGTQYGLSYQQPQSSRDGKPHHIEIRLRDSSLSVHQSRDHYVAN